MENFSSEAWESSECAAAREPVKALEQFEVVVVVATRGRWGRWSVWAERVIVTATHMHRVFDCEDVILCRPPRSLHSLLGGTR